jgi:hypothetical protein
MSTCVLWLLPPWTASRNTRHGIRIYTHCLWPITLQFMLRPKNFHFSWPMGGTLDLSWTWTLKPSVRFTNPDLCKQRMLLDLKAIKSVVEQINSATKDKMQVPLTLNERNPNSVLVIWLWCLLLWHLTRPITVLPSLPISGKVVSVNKNKSGIRFHVYD